MPLALCMSLSMVSATDNMIRSMADDTTTVNEGLVYNNGKEIRAADFAWDAVWADALKTGSFNYYDTMTDGLRR